MKTAIYPGSFDPVTEGHVDIIRRASKIFDRLYVAVMVNADKKTMFSGEERVELLKRVISDIENVEVVRNDGLLADFADALGALTIVKGIRNVADFDGENQMALINSKLNPKLDTIFLPTSSPYMFVSSSAVRAVASAGGDITGFVPKEIIEMVYGKIADFKSTSK